MIMHRWRTFATHVAAAVTGHLVFWTLTLVVPVLAA
jgi:Tfp pilus assembly pilus retraction ATPase PilT